MKYTENNTVPNDEMDVLVFHANEDLEMPVNEELPDELAAESKAIEFKKMIDMEDDSQRRVLFNH